MAKKETEFVCENCGNKESKWVGKCPVCGQWNTYVEEKIVQIEKNTISRALGKEEKLKNLKDVDATKLERIDTGFQEFNRVLGGGIVKDEVILIGGEPGIGKSTLVLQVIANLNKKYKTIYVSGEESDKQIALRARRLLGDSINNYDLNFLGNSNLSSILTSIDKECPDVMVIDSIQTLYDEDLASLPGSLAQVRSCSTKLTSFAKSKGIALIIIGHINKEGDIAGPKVLEHVVDCVLQFEGDSNHDYRILRSIKNRFGATGEVGIFLMAENGLEDIDLKNNIFSLSEGHEEIGIAKSVILEGNRPIILDIQSLANNTIFPYPKRVSEGIGINRLQLLCAIANSFKLANLNNKDVYLRISGGYVVRNNPHCDLAILASILSAAKSKAINSNFIFIGEVALNGRVFISNTSIKALKELERFPGEYKIVTSKSAALKIKKNNKNYIYIEKVGDMLSIF